MSYLTIIEQGPLPNRVTKIFSVQSKTGGQLGVIMWYAAWRRYCFYPLPETVLDAACLREITAFIESEMEARDVQKNQDGRKVLGRVSRFDG